MQPTPIKLHSENATFQQLAALRNNRNKRYKQQAFLVEGVRLVNQLLASDWQVNALLYSREAKLSNWTESILENSNAPVHYELSLDLMRKLSGKNNTSEVICVVAFKKPSFERLAVDTAPFIVVLDRPSNPGNLGTIIRSCDAFGVDGLIVTGHAADLYDPRTLAATAGSFFAVPALQFPSHAEVLPFLEALTQKHGALQIIGTSARAKTSLYQVDYHLPTLLLIGSEEKGLSHFYQSLANLNVTIPIAGKAATSLNVASAASILFAEARRQRGWS